MSEDDYESLATWAREEQVSLWYDLELAIRTAINGAWSMQAANVAVRIVSCARKVGPSSVGEIPWSLVAGGVYQAVLNAGEIHPEMPDETEYARVDAMMESHGSVSQTRAVAAPALARTVAAINTDPERRFINDKSE